MGDLKAQFEAAAKEIAAWKPAGKGPSDDEKLASSSSWFGSFDRCWLPAHASAGSCTPTHTHTFILGGLCAVQASDRRGLHHAQVSAMRGTIDWLVLGD
jgi:hypothetical protein